MELRIWRLPQVVYKDIINIKFQELSRLQLRWNKHVESKVLRPEGYLSQGNIFSTEYTLVYVYHKAKKWTLWKYFKTRHTFMVVYNSSQSRNAQPRSCILLNAFNSAESFKKLHGHSYLWALYIDSFSDVKCKPPSLSWSCNRKSMKLRDQIVSFFSSLNLRDQIGFFFLFSHPGYPDPLFL